MKIDELLGELERVEEKHVGLVYATGTLNISHMLSDVIPALRRLQVIEYEISRLNQNINSDPSWLCMSEESFRRNISNELRKLEAIK